MDRITKNMIIAFSLAFIGAYLVYHGSNIKQIIFKYIVMTVGIIICLANGVFWTLKLLKK